MSCVGVCMGGVWWVYVWCVGVCMCDVQWVYVWCVGGCMCGVWWVYAHASIHKGTIWTIVVSVLDNSEYALGYNLAHWTLDVWHCVGGWWHETSLKWLLFSPFSSSLYSDPFLSFDLSRLTLCLPLGWRHWLYTFPLLGSHTPTTQNSAITRPVSPRRMEVCVVYVWVCEGVHSTKHICSVFCFVYSSCLVYSSFISWQC